VIRLTIWKAPWGSGFEGWWRIIETTPEPHQIIEERNLTLAEARQLVLNGLGLYDIYDKQTAPQAWWTDHVYRMATIVHHRYIGEGEADRPAGYSFFYTFTPAPVDVSVRNDPLEDPLNVLELCLTIRSFGARRKGKRILRRTRDFLRAVVVRSGEVH
jgi:hypothetical protein